VGFGFEKKVNGGVIRCKSRVRAGETPATQERKRNMRFNGRIKIVVLALTFVLSGVLSADVRLPAVIGANMVLQQGMAVPIWGWADPCEVVRIITHWSNMDLMAVADANGFWKINIVTPSPPPPNGGPCEIIITGKNTIILKNVLVGDVWVCSGQSNMEFPLSWSANSQQEINEANYPQIRLFTVGKKVSYTPMGNCQGHWQECSPATAKNFSAVAYFFGREIHRQLGVPVGLIHASWSGTPAESWMSKEYLASEPNFQPILKRFDDTVANYPELKQKYNEQKAQYDSMAAKMRAEHKTPPPKPNEPVGLNSPYSPTGLFNGMIRPIIPYTIRGIIWYQGESNTGRAEQYRTLFPAMIKCWREAWKEGDLPFYYVQLANFMAVRPEPGPSEWAELREAQLMTLATPNTGMAVAIDVGEANNIHPKNKQDIGKRLSLWALAKTYKKDVEYSGPLYKYMEVKDNNAILHFDNVGGGLISKGGDLKGFAIAGADRKFVWADAKIEGDTVVVQSDKVAEPVAVRYGWADNPVCNLYNKANLPASPFRTDAWAGLTDAKR
jgi:sialate O-acetylesterase